MGEKGARGRICPVPVIKENDCRLLSPRRSQNPCEAACKVFKGLVRYRQGRRFKNLAKPGKIRARLRAAGWIEKR